MGSKPTTETLIAVAEKTIDRGWDAAIDLGLTIERAQEIQARIDRRLKVEGVFVFIAVASFLGCLAVRFG